MKTRDLLHDTRFYAALQDVDQEMADGVRSKGCRLCGGALHSGDYRRKPRGGEIDGLPRFHWRFSLCCARDGCRKRHTPQSVRFLGPKVYLAAWVLLVTVLLQGLTPARTRRLRKELGIDRHTLQRWREYWANTFLQSRGFVVGRARFHTPVDEGRMPSSLFERFEGEDALQQAVLCLRFVAEVRARDGPVDHGFPR